MFSKILIKLVDEAIVPALLLIVTRVVSIVFFASYLHIDYELGPAGFTYTNVEDYIAINSYSILSMVLVLSLGVLYILLKSYLFHDTHITPVLTAKLFSLRLSSFIQTSFDLYSQGTVWLSYSYLLLMVSAIMTFFGFIYTWVFLTALVFCVISTYFFVLDVEDEVFQEPSDKSKMPMEEVILNLEGIDEGFK
ncbi:MAG: hypothetical protein ACOZAO_01510 [Patescibacteria group bacterium]